MSQHDTDQLLDQMIDQLPASLQPSKDLWAGIDRGIDESIEKKRKHRWYGSIAASVFMLVGISGMLFVQPATDDQWVAYVEQLQSSHQTQMQSFGMNNFQQVGQMNNQALDAMVSELQGLRSAQNQVIEALKKNPDNVEMLQLLQWTQQQELRLMQQAQQMNLQYPGRAL